MEVEDAHGNRSHGQESDDHTGRDRFTVNIKGADLEVKATSLITSTIGEGRDKVAESSKNGSVYVTPTVSRLNQAR